MVCEQGLGWNVKLTEAFHDVWNLCSYVSVFNLPSRTLCMKESTMRRIQTLWPSGRCLTTWRQRRRKSFIVSRNSVIYQVLGRAEGGFRCFPPASGRRSDCHSSHLLLQCSSRASTEFLSRAWRASRWRWPYCPTPTIGTCQSPSPVIFCCCCPSTRRTRPRRWGPGSFRPSVTREASGMKTLRAGDSMASLWNIYRYLATILS